MGKTFSPIPRFRVFSLLFAFLPIWGCQAAGTTSNPNQQVSQFEVEASASSAEDLMVVDCLLPGQVRMLGNMNYLTPRRPAKVTALDCRIRGGEYVAYDRADLQNSLAVWLPRAEDGDPAAQTYLGEIYQRGMGATAPQYDKAAHWFQKAAEKGYERAQISLGYLYEKGLGVPLDPVKALNLYRNAMGGEKTIVLEADELTASERKELEGLRQEVETLRRELEEAQRKLIQTREEFQWQTEQVQAERAGLVRARAELERYKREMPLEDPDSRVRLEALEKALSQREALLEAQRQASEGLKLEVQRLEEESRKYQNQLERHKEIKSNEDEEILALRREATRSREEVQNLRTQLVHNQSELERLEREYAWRQEQVEAERQGLRRARTAMEKQAEKNSETGQAENSKLEKALADRQTRLDSLEQETGGLRKEVARLEKEAARYREQLEGYQEKVANLPEPSIEIIKPKVFSTRGKWVAANGIEGKRVELVGKVSALAGLYSLSVNEKPTQPDDGGLFKAWIPVTSSEEIQVRIIAVDKQGKRTDVEFVIPEHATAARAENLDPKLFGRYFALIIGNNDYQSLPDLDTAAADAQDLSKVLSEKYGFSTEVMINASRFDIYKALDIYRKKLTEKDNFLIYYAGHGELDNKNKRGYWLPVDADPDSFVNSIPNYTVTDILNNMNVKQAIIIADTCYSGILTRSVISVEPSGMSREKRNEWLKKVANERSRTVLSSGGLKPVLDAGTGGHSLFANALLEVLETNQDVMEASAVYRKVRSSVMNSAKRLGYEQVPQYAANLQAGHVGGDFLFVPAN